jgi:hypothetical protein
LLEASIPEVPFSAYRTSTGIAPERPCLGGEALPPHAL